MFFVYNDAGVVTQSVAASNPDEYRAYLVEHNIAHFEMDVPPAESIADMAVIDGKLVAREPMGATISAISVTAGYPVTLAGLPDGANVVIMGPHHDAFTATAPAEVLAFDVPGSYWLTVTRFPLRDAHFRLEVTP